MTLPRPSGVSVPETDCADGFTETVYENKTADDFSAYCASLQAHGWSPVAQSNFDSALVSATFAGFGKTVHTYFAAAEGCIRLVVGDALPASLSQPYAAELTATAPKAAMLGLNRNNGMALVFTLSDGSYIVYDGGETSADAELLYQYLSGNNRRADGEIVVAAWVVTHEHTDHYGALPFFAAAYGNRVRVENFLVNGYAPASVNPAISSYAGFLSDPANGSEAAIRGIARTLGAQVVKAHTGQVFEIRDAELKILFTHEDLYPNADPGAPINERTMDANDLSVVSMLTLGGKNSCWRATRSILPFGNWWNITAKAMCLSATFCKSRTTATSAAFAATPMGRTPAGCLLPPQTPLLRGSPLMKRALRVTATARSTPFFWLGSAAAKRRPKPAR